MGDCDNWDAMECTNSGTEHVGAFSAWQKWQLTTWLASACICALTRHCRVGEFCGEVSVIDKNTFPFVKELEKNRQNERSSVLYIYNVNNV